MIRLDVNVLSFALFHSMNEKLHFHCVNLEHSPGKERGADAIGGLAHMNIMVDIENDKYAS